ncbi:MAG: hypothetical protein Kow00133_11800 [Amphiplicatus sp.]
MVTVSETEFVEQRLASLKTTLFTKLELAALQKRNETAHKWKAPYRSLQLREVVYWRMLDLLDQSFILYKQNYVLGARILLRSALETLAVLIYLRACLRRGFPGGHGCDSWGVDLADRDRRPCPAVPDAAPIPAT